MLLTIMLLTAFHAVGQYSIDKVCLGTEKYYRVTGEINSTYTWNITDPMGAVTPQLSDRDTVGIIWNMIPGLYQLSVIQHAENGCDANIELGTVEVFAQPAVFAGNNLIQCAGNTVVLAESSAENYAGLMWSTTGDGTFDDSTALHPVYNPGTNDIIAGNVVLTLTASGLGNSGSCTPASSSVSISLSTIVPLATATSTTCFGIANGTVTLAATGGTEPYAYSLNGIMSNTGIYTGLLAGTYTYVISDSTDCVASGIVNVGSAAMLSAQLSSTQIDCFGASNGTITISGVSGGSGSYEYSIDSIIWQSSPSFAGLTAGTYAVYMRDTESITCTILLGSIVIAEPAILYAQTTHTNVTLPGADDGTITVIYPSGGSGVYEYSIDSINWHTSVIFNNLPAGAYTVFMRDANAPDCMITIGIEIIMDGLAVTVSVENADCFGMNNGEATATVSGGTPPYTYLWNDPSAQTTSIATGLTAGIYTVIVTDSVGTTAIATDTITQPDEVIPAFAAMGPLCENSTPPALPDTSLNGISGTWVPPFIKTTVIGISTYTFTPDTGQCASVGTIQIMVSSEIITVFDSIVPLCQNSIPPVLAGISTNGITGNWSPATINTSFAGITTYTFTPDTGQCATGFAMEIEILNELIPSFATIGPLCQNTTPPALADSSLNGVTGSWLPATINTTTAGATTYTFTPDDGQCSSIFTMEIVVSAGQSASFMPIGPLCINSNPPALPDTSVNGISGSWNPSVINTSVTGNTQYTFTPDSAQCASAITIQIEITDQIVPQFTGIGPLCQNTVAPALPSASTNGITGMWNPSVINTTIFGTTVYTFTPDSGQCAGVTTMAIQITNELTPLFNNIGPLCQNSTPPQLPAISLNGITGNWSPSTINTSAIGTSIYSFTPDTGQCASVVTLAVQVSSQIMPQFTNIGPLCQYSTPPALPATSLNGITGNWNPSVINTSTIGTTIYTFTPDTGQCAINVTMSIQISSQIAPLFATIGPLCQNSVSPTLPTTSLNGITGSWTPSVINTLDPSTTMYTFTPDAGQCATVLTLSVVVLPQTETLFASVGPLCQNSTAPLLADTSLNGITGNWLPAIISTTVTGTTAYTFTPDSGQCASTVILNIQIVSDTLPVFASIGPLCLNTTAPALLTISLNNVTGNWTPATINTAVTGISQYTFTPDPDQCASVFIMEIEVTDEIVPVFDSIMPLCLNTVPPVLPLTSLNGISGLWVPAQINSSIAGITSYVFTPDSGQCAVPFVMNVEITGEIIPVFAPVGPLCLNNTPEILPVTSLNGITGSWEPEVINTYISGNTLCTFTPDSGQCASVVTLLVGVGSPVIAEVQTFTATNGQANGYAVIIATGDIPPFTYSINGVDWQNMTVFSHLSAGNYTAYVKDASGCLVTTDFVIVNTLTGEVGVLAGDVVSCISLPIEIPVMAYDFTNISSFTIQLAFDSTVLSFSGLTALNDLLNNGHMTTTMISPGILQVTFVATDSITLLSDDLLFNLNFYGLASGHTDLVWNWLQCVIYSASGYEVPAIYTKGTVEIRPTPQIFAEGTGTYCENTPLKISAGSLTNQDLTYVWNGPNGVTHSGPEWDLGKLKLYRTGEYQVIASDSTSCEKALSVQIQVVPNPVINMADNDTVCSEQQVILNPGLGFADYLWQDGSKEPQMVSTAEGIYWVIVTDYFGCQGSDSTLLRPCELLIWMPNAFTPNGDGLNDEFGAKSNLDLDIDFRMLVFNKWGEEIFSSDDIHKGWDGTYKGKPCPPDMYSWTISFTAPPTYNFLQKSPQNGVVMLLK